MADKLLSIVIPTRDREIYCQKVIEYMLSIDDDRIEYVIQDNSSSNVLEDYVKSLSDTRIVYRHETAPLCQVDNSDHSIQLATGKYICFIGDDDIVLPNIMEIVEYAIENNIDSIEQKEVLRYEWPSELFPTGLLVIPTFTGEIVEINNLKERLRAYTDDGSCSDPRNFQLPTLYHGLIKKQCLDEIKNRTGHYIGGVSPDSFTSVSLANVVKSHILISKPFTILGACPKSATTANKLGHHCGELSQAPHLKNRVGYVWDSYIPRYYSVQTVWAESAITALREFGVVKNYPICLYKLFYKSYIFNRPIYKLILKETNNNLKRNKISFIKFWAVCAPYSAYMMANKLYRRFVHKKPNVVSVRHNNILEIQDCIKYLSL